MRKIVKQVCPLATGKHKFYTHEKCLSQSYRVGCHSAQGWKPHQTKEISPEMCAELQVKLSQVNFGTTAFKVTEEPMKKGQKTRASRLLSLFLHSKFQSSCPYLALSPHLTSTLRHSFSKLGVENKEYNT